MDPGIPSPILNAKGQPVQLLVLGDRHFSDLSSGLKVGQQMRGRVAEVLADGKAIVNFRGIPITAQLKGVTLSRGEVIAVQVRELGENATFQLVRPSLVPESGTAPASGSRPARGPVLDPSVEAALARLHLPADEFHGALLKFMEDYSLTPSRDSVGAIKTLIARISSEFSAPAATRASFVAPESAQPSSAGPATTAELAGQGSSGVRQSRTPQPPTLAQSGEAGRDEMLRVPPTARTQATGQPMARPTLQPVEQAMSRGYILGRVLEMVVAPAQSQTIAQAEGAHATSSQATLQVQVGTSPTAPTQETTEVLLNAVVAMRAQPASVRAVLDAAGQALERVFEMAAPDESMRGRVRELARAAEGSFVRSPEAAGARGRAGVEAELAAPLARLAARTEMVIRGLTEVVAEELESLPPAARMAARAASEYAGIVAGLTHGRISRSALSLSRIPESAQPSPATPDSRPSGVQRGWTPRLASLAQSQTTAQLGEAGRVAVPGQPAPSPGPAPVSPLPLADVPRILETLARPIPDPGVARGFIPLLSTPSLAPPPPSSVASGLAEPVSGPVQPMPVSLPPPTVDMPSLLAAGRLPVPPASGVQTAPAEFDVALALGYALGRALPLQPETAQPSSVLPGSAESPATVPRSAQPSSAGPAMSAGTNESAASGLVGSPNVGTTSLRPATAADASGEAGRLGEPGQPSPASPGLQDAIRYLPDLPRTPVLAEAAMAAMRGETGPGPAALPRSIEAAVAALNAGPAPAEVSEPVQSLVSVAAEVQTALASGADGRAELPVLAGRVSEIVAALRAFAGRMAPAPRSPAQAGAVTPSTVSAPTGPAAAAAAAAVEGGELAGLLTGVMHARVSGELPVPASPIRLPPAPTQSAQTAHPGAQTISLQAGTSDALASIGEVDVVRTMEALSLALRQVPAAPQSAQPSTVAPALAAKAASEAGRQGVPGEPAPMSALTNESAAGGIVGSPGVGKTSPGSSGGPGKPGGPKPVSLAQSQTTAQLGEAGRVAVPGQPTPVSLAQSQTTAQLGEAGRVAVPGQPSPGPTPGPSQPQAAAVLAGEIVPPAPALQTVSFESILSAPPPDPAQPSPGSLGLAGSSAIRPMPATAPPGGAGRGEILGGPARPAPGSGQTTPSPQTIETAVFLHAAGLPAHREIARAAHEFLFMEPRFSETLDRFEQAAQDLREVRLPRPIRNALTRAGNAAARARVSPEQTQFPEQLRNLVENLGLSHESRLSRLAPKPAESLGIRPATSAMTNESAAGGVAGSPGAGKTSPGSAESASIRPALATEAAGSSGRPGKPGGPAPAPLSAEEVQSAAESVKATMTSLRDAVESADVSRLPVAARESLVSVERAASEVLQVIQAQQVGSYAGPDATSVVYVQIPLVLGTELRGGEVQVSWKRDRDGRRRDQREPAHMTVRVETRALGAVDVRMRLLGQSLSLAINVRDEAVQEFVTRELPELVARLAGHNFKVDRCICELAGQRTRPATRPVAPTSSLDMKV